MLTMKLMFTKKKRLFAVIFALALVLGAGLWGYQYLQYQKRVADDRQRYESALTDMNKFFDALGSSVTNREVERTCDYGVGPWGDQGDLNCNVVIIARVSNYRQDMFADKQSLLGWEKSTGFKSSQLGGDYLGGERVGLSCDITVQDDKATALCYGRTEYQHYPRVDR